MARVVLMKATQGKFFQRAQNNPKVMKATNRAKMTLKKIHPDLHEDVVVDGLDNTMALLDVMQEETNNRNMHC